MAERLAWRIECTAPMKHQFLFPMLCVFAGCSASPTPTSLPVPSVDSAIVPDATADLATVSDVSIPPDTSTPTDLAALLEPLRMRYGLPALAAAVFDERGVVAQGVVGQRSVDDNTLATLNDRWHLGSCTKAMTATLFARLVERGTVRWEMTLAEAFPDAASTINPAYRTVTMEQLLQHRGGLPANIPSALWSALRAPGEVVSQRRNFAMGMLSRAPATPPGTQYVYSNAGYMLVGAALERSTGRAWEDLLSEEVFVPLGMSSCGFGAPATPDTVDQPWGHERMDGGVVAVPPGPNADNPPGLGPAGTVHCSLTDWSRFAQMHLRGARNIATDYLSAQSITRLHTVPAGGDYALGWIVTTRPWAGGIALTHEGSNTTFLATVWIAVARARILLVVTNVADDSASRATEATLSALIRAHVPTL
jgi:CubicO group peptidase (beta-lactamase class C family)